MLKGFGVDMSRNGGDPKIVLQIGGDRDVGEGKDS